MRVTKTMKEVIEQKLDEKRMEANRAARADYEKRRSACIDEISAIIEDTRTTVNVILAKYGMDVSARDYKGAVQGASFDEIIHIRDSNVTNYDERTKLSNAENKRFHAQKEALQTIIFDAEAGGDKESLLAAIATVNFEGVG